MRTWYEMKTYGRWPISNQLHNRFFPHGTTAPSRPGPPHYRGFTITFRHTTLGRTPLDEWPARRTDLYLTTHNTHNRQTSMPPAGFESTIPVSERPQTHALGGAATGIGCRHLNYTNNYVSYVTDVINDIFLYVELYKQQKPSFSWQVLKLHRN